MRRRWRSLIFQASAETIALPATCASAIRLATISQCGAGVHREHHRRSGASRFFLPSFSKCGGDGCSICDLREGAGTTLVDQMRPASGWQCRCSKFRSGEARNGTSFGIKQMRNLPRIIHDGSSRNRAVALRDRHAEPGGPEAYSCSTLRVRWASPPTEGSSQQRIGDCSRSVHE